MSVARHLLAGRFAVWLRQPPAPTPLWLFVHVPKTAGSSLAADISALLPPYRSIHIDHADRGRSARDRYDDATEGFLRIQAASPCRFASGHVQYRQVKRIQDALPGTRLFTMLREPIARLVSDYLYQRSSMHPLSAEVRAAIPDFATFVELKGQRNRAARHLLPPKLAQSDDVKQAMEALSARYAFIGIQERYELSFRALTTLLSGRPSRPSARKRVNDETASEKAGVLQELADPALQAHIRQLNALDFGLYAAVAAAYDRIAQPLETWLEQMERSTAA